MDIATFFGGLGDLDGSKKPASKKAKVSTTVSKPINKESIPKKQISNPKKSTPSSSKNLPKKNSYPRKRTIELDFESDFDDEEDDFKPEEESESDHEVVEILDDEEMDDLDDNSVVEIKQPSKPKRGSKTAIDASSNPRQKRKASPNVNESPKKQSSTKPTVKRTKKEQPASPNKNESTLTKPLAGSGKTAADVLETIPDAELPSQDQTTSRRPPFANKSGSGDASSPDIPEAQPNCLAGMTIVFTGVLPTLDRDQSANLAKKYGAKVTSSILGNTSLVVLGEGAGSSKVPKIKKFGIKTIDEDGFILLLKSMPADGGDGEAALKATAKRQEEERKILENAEKEMAEEAKLKEKIKLEKEKKLKERSNSGGEDRSAIPEREIQDSEKLWTVKHAPKSADQLCGNKGQILKLQSWLKEWFENSKKDFRSSGSSGGGNYRAALISGPPGIGKTSAAHLVAESLGFDVLEMNASDVRSKSLLNNKIKSVLNNTSVVGFFKHQNDQEKHDNDKKFCIIMDEVDGMSSGDHGGAGALSAFCRVTKMPMILVCNDKSLPKMRTFDKVTFDLPFRRPSEKEVTARLMTIALREGIKLDPTIIGQLVSVTTNDIRQMINLLSTISKTQKRIGHEQAKDLSQTWKKEAILKPFDVTSRFMNGAMYGNNSNSTLNDKINLYFNDIDIIPLMIQENYIYSRPTHVANDKEYLKSMALAADDISQSDLVNSLIRSSEQQWSLLPFHAVMSSVKPCLEVAGAFNRRINFPGWLGQNSKGMKYERLLQELQYHTRLRTFSAKRDFRLDYLPVLSEKLVEPLSSKQTEGIDDVINVMDNYFLTKEDWDTLIELNFDKRISSQVSKISTKTKSAFTRKYNSGTHPTAIYKTGNSVGGKVKQQKADYDDVVVDDTNEKEEDAEVGDGDDDIKKDKLIKQVKSKPKAKPKPKAKGKVKK